MADINNALALQVQAPQIDVAGTLGKIAAINATNASTERTQQEVEHNKFLYKQGGGYTPAELSTLASTQQQHMENAGRIGNAYLSNPNDVTWSASVDEAEKVGLIRGGTLEKAQYLAMPPAQRAAVAKALQQAGMSSQTSIEQSGIPAGNTTREAGKYIPEGLQPNVPYTSRTAAASGGPSQAKVDNAVKTGRNFDGSSRVLSTADVVGQAGDSDAAGAVGRTPAQAINDRFPNQSIFQPRIIRNQNGTISSSVTPETQGLQASAVDRFKQMQDNAGRAQGLMGQLDAIEHENETLNSAGWSSTGTGANAKLGAAKTVNSLFTSIGMAPPIDPEKVASWEGYNKQTTRAGFELARTLGGHQAESVIQSSVGATPNVENTYFGSKVITNSIRQTVQREVDMYRYSLEYAKRTGSTFGAEDEFNRKFPPKLYSQTAVANAIPDASIQRLTASGGAAKDKAQFDSVYGKGMADFVLQRGQH